MVFGILEQSGDTFGGSWRVFGEPCGTKWLPDVAFLDFGCDLGFILGGVWGPGLGLGGHLGAFWWPLGGLLQLLFGFVSEYVQL